MSQRQSSSPKGWIGLDIGGVNIKIVTMPERSPDPISVSTPQAISIAFALWKHPEKLANLLTELLSKFDREWGIAITMTGELADCFPNRQVGVNSIIDATLRAVENLNSSADTESSDHVDPKPSSQRLIRFFQLTPTGNGYHWADPELAKQGWLRTAAANWYAIATFLGQCNVHQLFEGNGFLIDIGSTTTDIIPIRRGLPTTLGMTDLTRLQSGELVYAGVQRTPLCSLINAFEIHGKLTPIAREHFASIEDAFLITKDVDEEENRFDTADGRAATRLCAMQRMAKMVCSDSLNQISDYSSCPSELKSEFINQLGSLSLAHQSVAGLRTIISRAVLQVVVRNADLPQHFLITGQGDWFAERILRQLFHEQAEIIRVANILGAASSQAMAAHSVMKIAARDFSNGEQASVEKSQSDLEFDKRNEISLTQKRLRLRVVKIGGSLLDWPETPARAREWLSSQVQLHNIWIVGGGKLVDTIREFDKLFSLNESLAHRLCLDGMSLNLQLVKTWFPDWPIVNNLSITKDIFNSGQSQNVLFDFSAWLKQPLTSEFTSEEPLGLYPDVLPEAWSVTSDTCAAFLAASCKAEELILFKSCSVDPNYSNEGLLALVAQGIVDSKLPEFARPLPALRIVNLRDIV